MNTPNEIPADWLERTRRCFTKRWRWACFVIAVLFFVPLPLLSYYVGSEVMAKLGESYIIWHSFFETLACILLGATLILQFCEVRQKEAQFDMQIKAQEAQFDTQVKAHRIQSVFFPYLVLFSTYVNKTFPHGFDILAESLEKHDDKAELPSAIESNIYDVQSYHRHLTVLVELIGSAGISDKETNDYLRVLHAQLSEAELVFIRGCRKFAPGEELKRVVDKLDRNGLDVRFLIDGQHHPPQKHL